MQSILEQITDWLKSMIISGIMGNLSGMFDSVNQQVGQIAGDVGTTPANFSPAVFSMIRNISEYRSKLSALPVCTGIPGISYHNLCRHLCSSDSEPVLFG